MIIEYIRYTIGADRGDDFRAAYGRGHLEGTATSVAWTRS